MKIKQVKKGEPKTTNDFEIIHDNMEVLRLKLNEVIEVLYEKENTKRIN